MKNVFRTHISILGALALIYLLFAGASAGIQAAAHANNKKDQSRNQTLIHFWRAVDGSTSTNAPSIDNTLAIDLREVYTSNAKIRAFRGDSNRYGGISDAIGFDPFDGSGLGCVECGPLKPSVERDLRLVAAGRVDVVIQASTVDYDTSGYTLTPFGMSFFGLFLFTWFVIVPSTYLVALAECNERIKRDTYTLVVTPYVYAVMWYREHHSNNQQNATIRSQFPEYAAMLEDVDEALANMHQSPEREQLRQMRNEVQVELLKQVSQSQSAKSDDELVELTSTLDQMSQVLKARAQAKKDLENL